MNLPTPLFYIFGSDGFVPPSPPGSIPILLPKLSRINSSRGSGLSGHQSLSLPRNRMRACPVKPHGFSDPLRCFFDRRNARHDAIHDLICWPDNPFDHFGQRRYLLLKLRNLLFEFLHLCFDRCPSEGGFSSFSVIAQPRSLFGLRGLPVIASTWWRNTSALSI